MKSIRIKTGDIKTSIIMPATASKPLAAIIFIHGFPFNKSIWKKQLEALPEGVRGIIYDVRGHGSSSSGHGYFNVDMFAKDLLNLINILHLPKVILCGISMGGYIALRATELDPEKIKGLVLCSTHSLADTNEVKLNRFAQIEKIMTKDKAAFADEFIKKLFSETTFKEKPETVDIIRQVILNNKEKNICATLLALASRTDTTDFLDNIRVPVLIIRGEDDQIITGEQTEILQKGIKDAELKIIPLSAHLPNLENPEHFNETLKDFLTGHFLP